MTSRQIFWRCFVSLVKFMSISSLVLENQKYPRLSFPKIWRLGRVMDTKFGTNISNRMSLNAAKFQGYSFCRFWVIKGKPTGGGVNLTPPPTQIQGCFIIFAVRLLAEALQKLYIPSQITIIFVIAFYIMRHLCYPENKQNQELKMPDVLK